MPIKVLFVCLGNICRSPMAEAVFSDLVQKSNLQDHFEIDSAGTGDWHIDSAAHPGTLGILEENGIFYEGTGRQIARADLDIFDYILTMDDENLHSVKKLGKGHAQVFPLLHFARDVNKIREVPDPYFVGGFDVVHNLVNAGCSGLLEHIRREHQLPPATSSTR